MGFLADSLSEFTLQVVLATFPQTQEKEFDQSVRKEFYENYWKTSKDYLANPEEDKDYGLVNGDPDNHILYNPLSYIMLGNYDIAYISLIDNFKFAQRLFEPQLAKAPEPEKTINVKAAEATWASGEQHDDAKVLPEEPDPKSVGNSKDKKFNLFAPHTFQSFTGITHHTTPELEHFFYDHLNKADPKRKFFLGICNLKLNNGFLLGNGKDYLDIVLKQIDKVVAANAGPADVPKVEYLKLQSFSWFEVSLLLFTDEPQLIANIIQQLRRQMILNLDEADQKIIEKSLYHCLFKKENPDFSKTNLFADTHTYFGVHTDVFDLEDLAYYEQFKAKNFDLHVEVEWQIKPGHLHILTDILSKNEDTKCFVTPELEKHFLAGRSDYSLKRTTTVIPDVVRLIRSVISRKDPLFEHVRHIRSRVYFMGIKPSEDDEKKTVVNLHQKLMVLAEGMDEVARVNDQLKAMKLSRQIRSKVLKIFSNYNNGIQDIILFPYLLDLKIFMVRLKTIIEEKYKQFEARFNEPDKYTVEGDDDKLEDILMKMIDIFQEGFNIRMLNPYQFEDINDFDLDFNSSIQQLLSVYSSMAFEIGNLIYAPSYTYGPIVQLNLKDTVSNDSSINYYVHHLTSPEFVFATLTKEIINALPKDDDKLAAIFQKYENSKQQLLERNIYIKDLDDRHLINLSYFFNDAFRYVWTYNMNFDVFYYWFWTYNFQNASLYNEIGLMNESHFEKELFRILFIARFFYPAPEDVEDEEERKKLPRLFCPLPELETYWERHFDRLAEAAKSFVKHLNDLKVGIDVEIINYIQGRLNIIMTKGEEECSLTNKDDDARVKFMNGLKEGRRLKVANLGNEFNLLMARRRVIFNDIVNEPEGVPKHSIIYLEWYMWKTLNEIYEMNDGRISLVRRNWKDGSPMITFVRNNDARHLYSVDQTGGLFFDGMKAQNRYFKYSCAVLLELWTFSLVRKKTFIETVSKTR